MLDSIKRELYRWGRSPVYLMLMIVIPLGCAFFFLSLLSPGLPLKTPVVVVDLDHSSLSRQMVRSLEASSLLDVKYKDESFATAMQDVREGKVYGFIVIPSRFQEDALANRKPTVDFYSNMTYFVPGTFAFKGFKTIVISTSGGVMKSQLSFMGLPPSQTAALLQPVVFNMHPVGNPWLNYSYYLAPSFTFATLSLLIMLTTVFSVTVEIKNGTSVDWLATAHNRIVVALAGKLLPQTLVFSVVAVTISAIMFGFLHFPMHGSMVWFGLALLLFVAASQAFALLVCSALPNPRLAFSVVSLLSVLAFSFAGFSFPVENMYGAIAIFSYIVPVRYLFLIYINTALNGFDVFFVRYFYVALIAFLPLGLILANRLKNACLTPVYVP